MRFRRALLSVASSLLLGSTLCGAVPGWNSSLELTVEGSAGLRGGLRRGQALQGLALGQIGWNQAASEPSGLGVGAFGSVLALAGRGPTERFVGDFLAASNIEGHDGPRLYTWWVEARHGDWSLRGGALLADEEFAGTIAGSGLLHSAFGWPAFISANTINTGPAFYVPALGLRFERTLRNSIALRIGVYDGDSFDSAGGDPAVNRHGLHFHVGGNQGWFAIGEAASTREDAAWRWRLGGWVHSANFPDVLDDATGQPFTVTGNEPRQHGANFGAYLAVERTLRGEFGKDDSLDGFFRIGVSPERCNAIGWAVDTGLSWTGLLPGRKADVTVLGMAHADFSNRFVRAARLADARNPPPDFEQAIELSHTLVLSEAWTIQPDLQYIRHPGGSTAIRNAVVALVRVSRSF